MRSYASTNNSDRLRSPEMKSGNWSSQTPSFPSHGSAAQPSGSKYLSTGSSTSNGSAGAYRDSRAVTSQPWQQPQYASDRASGSAAAGHSSNEPASAPGVLRYGASPAADMAGARPASWSATQAGNRGKPPSPYLGAGQQESSVPSPYTPSAVQGSKGSSPAFAPLGGKAAPSPYATASSNWANSNAQAAQAASEVQSSSSPYYAARSSSAAGAGSSQPSMHAGATLASSSSSSSVALASRYTNRRADGSSASPTQPSNLSSYDPPSSTSLSSRPPASSSTREPYSSATSIHRDLDSVLDDIKRELGKSRPAPAPPPLASSSSAAAARTLSLSIDAPPSSSASASGLSSTDTDIPRASSHRPRSFAPSPSALAAAEASNAAAADALASSPSPSSSFSSSALPSSSSSMALFAASRDTVASRIDALRSRLDTSRAEASSSTSSRPPASTSSLAEAGLTSSLASAASTLPHSDRGSAIASRGESVTAKPAPGESARDKEALANGQSVHLAEGWEMKLDSPSGRIFYVNHTLKAITWEPPLTSTAVKTSSSKTAALDQLSERTKALGAKLRDEMKQATEERRHATMTPQGRRSGDMTAPSTVSPVRDARGLPDPAKAVAASSIASRLDSLVSKGAGAREAADKVAERVADRLAERLRLEGLGGATGGGGGGGAGGGVSMYGSVGSREEGRGWNIESSEDTKGGREGIKAHGGGMYSSFGGQGGGGEQRWSIGASGDSYAATARGGGGGGGGWGASARGADRSFWHGGRDAVASNKGSTAMRSSLDSTRFAGYDKGGQGLGGRMGGGDPTMALLNQASSSLWDHLLNAGAVRRDEGDAADAVEGGGGTAADLAHFDQFARMLAQSEPRDLDESPTKKAEGAEREERAAQRTKPQADEASAMAWQV